MGLQRSEETSPAVDESLATSEASLCGELPPRQGEEPDEAETETVLSNCMNANVDMASEVDATTSHDGTVDLLVNTAEKNDNPQCGGGGGEPANAAKSRQETDLEVAKLLSIPDYCNSKTANIFAESDGSLDEEKGPTPTAPEIASDNSLDLFLSDKILQSVDLDDWLEQQQQQRAMAPLTQDAADPLSKMDTVCRWTNNPFASEDECSNPAEEKKKPAKRVRFDPKLEAHLDVGMALQEPWVYQGTAPWAASPPPPNAGQEGTTTQNLGTPLPEPRSEKANSSKNGWQGSKPQEAGAFDSSESHIDPPPVPAFFLDADAKDVVRDTRSGLLRYMGIEQEGWKTIIVVKKVSVLVHPVVVAAAAKESATETLSEFTTGWGMVESRADDPTAFRLIVCDETMDPRQFILAIEPGMKVQSSSPNGLTIRVCNYTAGEQCQFITIQGPRETMATLTSILFRIISKPRV